MIAVVRITNPSLADVDSLSVNIDVQMPGAAFTDFTTVNLSGVTPAQAINALKNRIVNLAANNGIIITTANVWIFGGPQ
jgi:hypothetical protein